MPTDLYLSVRGARLRYRVTGRGPPLVLVHGWTLDLTMWEPQVAAFAESFRVVRFDRRGFGMSSGRPGLEQDVADIEALGTRLGLGRAALVGMSQGARAVARFAARRPDAVSCLALDGPPAGLFSVTGAGGEEIPLAEYRTLVRRHGAAAFRARWRRHPLMRLRSTDPAAHQLLAGMIARYPANDLRAAPRSDAGGHQRSIARLRAPVLVITGALDLAKRRAAADLLARRLPLAERLTVPEAAHLPNLDNPCAYNAGLRDFLERHGRD
jgi:pimeloyl-ACP methyl ester carboxylesterase